MAALSAKDAAALRAPLAFAVEEYQAAFSTLAFVCVPISGAAFAASSYAAAARPQWDVHGRWAVVGSIAAGALLAFFLYGVVHVVEALRAIARPGFVRDSIARPSRSRVLRARYSERLGNNVFQYVFARLRAQREGLAFEAPPLGRPFDSVPQAVPYVAACGTCDQEAEPLPSAIADSDLVVALCASIDEQPEARHAAAAWLRHPVSGYVMNTCLFAGEEAAVAAWLQPSLAAAQLHELRRHPAAPMLAARWSPRDVAVHVRLGDILWGHHCAYRPLPVSFYRAALAAVAQRLRAEDAAVGGGGGWAAPLGRVVLVTEDASHEIVIRLQACLEGLLAAGGHPNASAPTFTPSSSPTCTAVLTQSLSSAADFLSLAAAPALVLSVSSFSWWAAALGNARTVVLPDFGLFRQHAWAPRPGLTAPHDMTLRAAITAKDLRQRAKELMLAARASMPPAALLSGGGGGAPPPRGKRVQPQQAAAAVGRASTVPPARGGSRSRSRPRSVAPGGASATTASSTSQSSGPLPGSSSAPSVAACDIVCRVVLDAWAEHTNDNNGLSRGRAAMRGRNLDAQPPLQQAGPPESDMFWTAALRALAQATVFGTGTGGEEAKTDTAAEAAMALPLSVPNGPAAAAALTRQCCVPPIPAAAAAGGQQRSRSADLGAQAHFQPMEGGLGAQAALPWPPSASLGALAPDRDRTVPLPRPPSFGECLFQSARKHRLELEAGLLAESPRVVRLQLPPLRRWDGYWAHNVESLFDEGEENGGRRP